MVKEQEPQKVKETHNIAGIVFESPKNAKTEDGYDKNLYDKVRSRAIGDNTALQFDQELLQNVEGQLLDMLGTLPPSQADALLELADGHSNETNTMINGFVDNIKNSKKAA
jgi:hypothetical protein